MANPGYPMQPMQPMGGPPMGGPPMGGPPMGQPGMRPPQPVSRGTPKAVPVMVSAGLAIGVFCGLLFGVGTGDDTAHAKTTEDKKFVGTKIDGADDDKPTAGDGTVGIAAAPPKSVTDGKLATGTIKEPTPAAGSAAGSGSAGSAMDGSGAKAADATVTPTIPKIAKVVIELKPASVALKNAKITVDGTEVEDGKLDVPLGDLDKKTVTVAVKASGYRDVEQKFEVEGETKITLELVKRSSGGSSGNLRRPDPPGGKGGGKKGGGKKKGGGLIDI